MNTTGDKNVRRMISALALCSLAYLGCTTYVHDAAAASATCLSYSTAATTLRGEISAAKITYPHGVANPSRYNAFHLHLMEPICVNRGLVDDGLEPRIEHVEVIELGAVTADEYRALQSSVGRIAQCTGSIVPPVTGYHLADLILLSPRCIAERAP